MLRQKGNFVYFSESFRLGNELTCVFTTDWESHYTLDSQQMGNYTGPLKEKKCKKPECTKKRLPPYDGLPGLQYPAVLP